MNAILLLVVLAICVVFFFIAKANLAKAVSAYQSYLQSKKSDPYGADKTELKNSVGVWNILRWVSIGLSGLFAVLFLFCFITTVQAGHVAVLDTFGSVSDTYITPGVSFINPLATPREMNVQTTELKEEMDCPTREGLSVHLEVSMIMHLNPSFAPSVYRTVGMQYVERIVLPQFRSIVRGATASFDAKSLYTSDRDMLSRLIKTQLDTLLESRGVVVEATPLRKVNLPEGLATSITEKLKSEQESQRMQFVLTKEKQEAERKRIEAQGIHDFQVIVTTGISEPLLRWKGIEATERLATSNNAKVVIIGAGKDGLPIILDTK